MSRKYKFLNASGAYFVSFATVYWIDVFTRAQYFKVLADSVDYCRAEKEMELFAYCFMQATYILYLGQQMNSQQIYYGILNFTQQRK